MTVQLDDMVPGRGDGAWPALLDALDQVAAHHLGDKRIVDDLAMAEGPRYLVRLLAAGALTVVENADPAYPHLTKIESPFMQFGLPNPDYVYWHAPLHGEYRYRIRGPRGTVRAINFEVYDGTWDRLTRNRVADSKLSAYGGGGELVTDSEGNLDIILEADPRGPNSLRVPPGASSLIIREMYYDWETEEAPRLAIERIGATYPPPPATPQMLHDAIDRLRSFLLEMQVPVDAGLNQSYAADPGTVPFAPLPGTPDLGFTAQFYGTGRYCCGPDEAVILTVRPPECSYWGFHLVSQYWESWDWPVRSTSINGHQGVLDGDGTFRAVISHVDPGVPNWLDAGNHPIGLIGGRYVRSQDEDVPVPTLTTVPLEKVVDVLPPDTPRVSPEERSEQLRRRMLSVRRRFAD